MLADRPIHATLPAADFERAKRFYTEKLGLTPENEAPEGNRTGDAPDAKIVRIRPHADVDSRPFDGGGESRKQVGIEPDLRVEDERPDSLVGRQECNRDLGGMSFLATQAGPECLRDDFFDEVGTGFGCRGGFERKWT